MAWFNVKTYYKKSCEQHEHFSQHNGEGKIKIVDGFRFCEYSVETSDGKFPEFEFTEVPGGDGKIDSLNLNCLSGSNIESSELVEMYDGGCWGDIDFTNVDDDEEENLRNLISEEGSYALENDGEWYLDETDVWVWGPLIVTDEQGNQRIICADENGNVVDFKERS